MVKKAMKVEVPEDIKENWQEITDILANLLGISAALVMRFTDPDIEVFVSSGSRGNPYQPGDKDAMLGSGLYCETVMRTKKKLLIPNALEDPDWKDNPDVNLSMISYLGYPILMPDGDPFGTLCVLDSKPNAYSETIEKLMMNFRNLLESHLELLYMNHLLGGRKQRLADYLDELQFLRGIVPICANCKSIRDAEGGWHPIEEILVQHLDADFSHGICPECKKVLYPDLK
ncbi:hypothetical protein DSLASN_13270 [Desulfoluna limicola]|uniref:GAF domain-containing protein n=1 Tax=Desulfoluna limicola TaxID=2810562 RepID=A0ABN6F2D8_9BACT|nr:GAF domain-containing protein [Desulfoluna limicola]BCS95695.1 hypothetical protein DSLASN_13270 [Desulfoluna limicola]